MSIEDQQPDGVWARFAESCQMGLYHLTGNDNLPPRWGGVAYFGLLALNVAAYGWVAVCYLRPGYATYLPAPVAGELAGALEPVGAAAAPADPRFIPAAGGMPPWPALEPAAPGRHLHALPTPVTESEAA